MNQKEDIVKPENGSDEPQFHLGLLLWWFAKIVAKKLLPILPVLSADITPVNLLPSPKQQLQKHEDTKS